MRQFESPYVADWFAASVRWFVLVGLMLSLSLRGQLNSPPFWALMLVLLWNIIMSAMAGLSVRLNFHRQIVLGVDIFLAGLFYWTQGGHVGGTSVWVSIIPIASGAIYFELWGALISTGLFVLWQVFVLRGLFSNGFPSFLTSSEIILTLLFGAMSAALGRYAIRRMRISRRTRVDAEERRSRMESERLRAIYELTSTLTATLSYKRVLDSALDLGYDALNPTFDADEPRDERLVSAMFLFRGNELRIGSARRFTNADMRVNLPGNEGILKKIFDNGEATLTTDVGYDPELGRIIALRACTSAYCFPLRSGFNVYGAMLFAHPDPSYFTQERCGLLDIIGRQAVIAVQNARLYQDLVEEKERMVEVQEETRKKLARDLHDGPTQSVAAMAMRINLVRRMMAKGTGDALDELVKIEELGAPHHERDTPHVVHPASADS